MAQMSDIDQALRQATQARRIAGVVAVAATDREIIYQGAFGRRDIDKPEPIRLDSVFWIASMTKAITATAAMQLVEQGRLSLDDTLPKLLPDFPEPQVLDGFDADGRPKLRAPKRAITLRHLLTHTAGYSYNYWNPLMRRYAADTGLPAARSGLNKALSAPLVFDPGERWEYGINIDVVGKAVEAASGKRLDRYLADHIFDPLGMRDTSFSPGPAQRARLVAMHRRMADGSLASEPFALTETPEFHPGGGGLFGTAPDYIRFVRMLLAGGTLEVSRVLAPATVALMGQNHIGDLNVTRMVSAMPEVSNDFDPFSDQERKWGLSFLINTRPTAEGRSPGSLAWAGAANTYFWADPARKVCGVIMMQLFPWVDAEAIRLFGAFERGVYARLANIESVARMQDARAPKAHASP